MTLFFDEFDSPVGRLRVVCSECGVRSVRWSVKSGGVAANRADLGNEIYQPHRPLLQRAREQLNEYFAGARTEFKVPLDMQGTEFQRSVWTVLCSIPFGTTISYQEQARRLGDVRKARAVGMANGKNPIGILVPCHRVIGKDGSLTGFAAGLESKAFLLNLESKTLMSLATNFSMRAVGR